MLQKIDDGGKYSNGYKPAIRCPLPLLPDQFRVSDMTERAGPITMPLFSVY